MENYAKIARQVEIAMRHQAKPCIGEPCDLDAPCKRHARTGDLVFRLWKRRNNALDKELHQINQELKRGPLDVLIGECHE